MENATLLLERYKILEPLGEGGSSKVVKAFDNKMERTVAIKMIPAGRRTAVRALREAKTVALLNHPNIVTLYEFEQSDGYYYLIMDYVEGLSLAALLQEMGRLPIEAALAVAIQVCDALEFAHKSDVIHRDIKPANLRILADGRVKVMDFGIARLRSAAKTSGVTADGEVVGTFAYMSPEQSSGEMVDERSDIFSMGVLLYEMVTGRLPFSADTPAGTIYKILNEEAPPASELANEVSPALSASIAKAMAKFADDRFPTAADLRTKLERCRQSTATPTEVIKDMLEAEAPADLEGAGALAALRYKITSQIRQYQDTIIATAYAVSVATAAAWANSYLPFVTTEFKMFFPITVFFLALFLPAVGLAALLALIAAGMWQVSPYLGLITFVAGAVYWMALGQQFPQMAILPLLAPFFAWLEVPFILPLAVGLVYSPVLAAFLAGFGALTLGAAEVIGQLNYSWSIGLRPGPTAGLKFHNRFEDILMLIRYFKAQPWLWGQAVIWAAVGGATAATKSLKVGARRWLALAVGAAGLIAGYLLVPDYLALKLSLGRLVFRPLGLSLIVMAAFIIILVSPPKRFSN